jgi:hypothetical protein
MRLVAAFRDGAKCHAESGAVQWRLSGADRDGDGGLEIMLCGTAGLQLPAQLPAAKLYVRGEPAAPAWELRSGQTALPLNARAVQVHRGVSAAFARALPPVIAPWSVRAGWVLLLNALRVPGVMRLLQALRGASAADGAGSVE